MGERKTRLLEVSARALTLPGLRLVVQRGPDKGRALKIEQQEVMVGTSQAAQLQLTDTAVSRSHLSITISDEGIVLTDLGSTNGTFIDKRRVQRVHVEPGDKIDLGDTRMKLEASERRVQLALSESASFGRMIGASVAARRMFAMLEQVAPTDATVLLLGETGTGKDGLAEALHEKSSRAAGPFVVFDCGAVAEGLIESELFGHEAGAFTGAQRRRIGAFEEASGGTLFLDEIGELPRHLQSKLLRAIERREVRRVGGQEVVLTDVRIVAATHRDLRLEVNRGAFREDLFYRLNVVHVRVPPLRERLEDVRVLAEHFWRVITKDADAVLPEALAASLMVHDWPGNVRELRNFVERGAVIDEAPTIAAPQNRGGHSFKEAKTRANDEFERAFLAELIGTAKGNVSEASRLAQMDRVHLAKLLRKHGLHRP